MVVAEFIANFLAGRGRDRAPRAPEPSPAVRQFINNYQSKCTYVLGEDPSLSSVMIAAMDRNGQGTYHLKRSTGSISIINRKDEMDGTPNTKIGIFIDGVWIEGQERSYRVLTIKPDRGVRGYELYFAEFFRDKGQTKVVEKDKDKPSSMAGAEKVFNLALELASKEPRS